MAYASGKGPFEMKVKGGPFYGKKGKGDGFYDQYGMQKGGHGVPHVGAAAAVGMYGGAPATMSHGWGAPGQHPAAVMGGPGQNVYGHMGRQAHATPAEGRARAGAPYNQKNKGKKKGGVNPAELELHPNPECFTDDNILQDVHLVLQKLFGKSASGGDLMSWDLAESTTVPVAYQATINVPCLDGCVVGEWAGGKREAKRSAAFQLKMHLEKSGQWIDPRTGKLSFTGYEKPAMEAKRFGSPNLPPAPMHAGIMDAVDANGRKLKPGHNAKSAKSILKKFFSAEIEALKAAAGFVDPVCEYPEGMVNPKERKLYELKWRNENPGFELWDVIYTADREPGDKTGLAGGKQLCYRADLDCQVLQGTFAGEWEVGKKSALDDACWRIIEHVFTNYIDRVGNTELPENCLPHMKTDMMMLKQKRQEEEYWALGGYNTRMFAGQKRKRGEAVSAGQQADPNNNIVSHLIHVLQKLSPPNIHGVGKHIDWIEMADPANPKVVVITARITKGDHANLEASSDAMGNKKRARQQAASRLLEVLQANGVPL